MIDSKLAVRASAVAPMEFTEDQRKLILNSFLSGASEQEAAVLLELARLRRLNPITRQIHFVKRWDSQRRAEVWSAQVGIDGFRSIAERTGLYDGQDEPEFEYEGKTLKLCRVRVYRKDHSRPAVGVAHFSEYAQLNKEKQLTAMWATKPHVMLAKCAEALAFRKAFPEDTSGLYSPEEMGAEEKDVTPNQGFAPTEPAPADPSFPPASGKRTTEVKARVAARTAKTPTPTPFEQIEKLCAKHGKSGGVVGSIIRGATGKQNRGQLTQEDVRKVEQTLAVLAGQHALEPEPDNIPPPEDADFIPYAEEGS